MGGRSARSGVGHRGHRPRTGSPPLRALRPAHAVILAAVLGACSGHPDGDGSSRTPHRATPSRTLPGTVARSIELQESDSALLVAPYLTLGQGRDVWVADALEQRISRFDGNGRLILAFGRKGQGPGEFVAPMRVLPLSPDSILVVDPGRGALLLDSSGLQLGSLEVPLGTLTDAVRVGPTLVAIAGRSLSPHSPHRVAILDPSSGETEAVLVAPSLPAALQLLESSFGFVKLAARGDTLAAIHSLVDSVWIRHPGGAVGVLPLRFRDARPPLPTDYLSRSRRDVVRELRRHHDLFWLPDGTFLVQTGTGGAGEETWDLFLFDASGNEVGAWRGVARMLALRADTAIFVDPGSLAPNRWVEVRVGR